MLTIRRNHWLEMVGHALDGVPDEACGLLGGSRDGRVQAFLPCPNADASSRTYSIDGRDILRAERTFEASGWDTIGVMHSHTHTEAFPSPTDVEKATLLAGWHFVIVSLRPPAPTLRSFMIEGGNIAEEPVVLIG